MIKQTKSKIVFDHRTYKAVRRAAEIVESIPFKRAIRSLRIAERPLTEYKKFIAISPFHKVVPDIDDVEKTQVKDNVFQTLLLDDRRNVLFFDENHKVTLRPEETKLVMYMRKQPTFNLEQILTDFFEKNLTDTYKHQKSISSIFSKSSSKPSIKDKPISKGDRIIFDVHKSNINRKCKGIDINELIQRVKGEKKGYKLSRKIEIKFLQT